MDDFYFDRKMKQVSESAPELTPSWEAMKDMRKRLRRAKAGQVAGFKASALWPLIWLLLLATGGGFLLWQNNRLSRDVHRLEQLYGQTLHRDTVVEKHVVYRYDTIYSVVYRDRYIVPASMTAFGPPSDLIAPKTRHHNAAERYGISGLSLLDLRPSSGLLSSGNNRSPAASMGPIGKISPLETLVFGTAVESLRPLRPDFDPILNRELPEIEQPRIPIHYHFTPSGLGVDAHYSPLALLGEAPEGNAFTLGARAAVEFPGDRRLLVGAEWFSFGFEEKDEAGFARFPVADPDDPTHVLHELKGRFSYFQIPLEFEQTLWQSQHFRSAISVGMVAYRPVRQQFTYEFLGGFEEHSRSTSFRNGNFSIDNLRLGVGIDYRLFKRMWLRPRFLYQHGFSLNTSEYFPLRYWSANVGLRFDLAGRSPSG